MCGVRRWHFRLGKSVRLGPDQPMPAPAWLHMGKYQAHVLYMQLPQARGRPALRLLPKAAIVPMYNGIPTRWRREVVLQRNASTGTRFGVPRTGKSSSSLVNRRRSLTRRRLPLLVLPASVLTGNEEGSLPSCWGLSMCHRRAQRASQIARTASGRYLSTGFCHERPFLLVKSHQPDST